MRSRAQTTGESKPAPFQVVAISLPGMARYDQLTNTAIDRCLQSEKVTIGIDKLDMSFQIKHKIVMPLIIPRMARYDQVTDASSPQTDKHHYSLFSLKQQAFPNYYYSL